MTPKKILLIFILLSCRLTAQNLISNPGFENYSALPSTYGDFSLATGWENCSGGGTPDYFNTAGTVGNYFGTNLPHTGDGMGGFCPYHGSIFGFREYFSTALSSPMVAGQTYSVSFWLSSGINGNYGFGCNKIGVNFSAGPLIQTGTSPILLTPQVEITSIFYDTLWTQFSFLYTAASAFDYFTIGNFRDDANTQIAQFGIAYDAVYYFVDDIDVELANLQPAAIFSSVNHICPGTCTNFTNLSQNATSYVWTFAGANPSTSTDVNPTSICYNTPGSYPVSLVAINSFTSDTLTLNNYITVYPYPPPQGIMQSGDTLIANQGAVSYQWFFNGNSIPGATDFFYIAPQSGDYNIVCTDENGCEVEAVIFNVIAGAPEKIGNGLLAIFPNPVSDKLIIQKSQVTSGTTNEISLYNIVGEKFFSIMPIAEINCDRVELDVSQLSKGSYWIEISDGIKKIRRQFIKQ